MNNDKQKTTPYRWPLNKTATVVLLLFGLPLAIELMFHHIEARRPFYYFEWLPPSAEVLLFRDERGWLNGDHHTFLVFRCSPTELRTILRHFSGEPHTEWLAPPIDEDTKRLLDSVSQSLHVPLDQMPDLSTDSIRWVPRTLIFDPKSNRAWYFELST